MSVRYLSPRLPCHDLGPSWHAESDKVCTTRLTEGNRGINDGERRHSLAHSGWGCCTFSRRVHVLSIHKITGWAWWFQFSQCLLTELLFSQLTLILRGQCLIHIYIFRVSEENATEMADLNRVKKWAWWHGSLSCALMFISIYWHKMKGRGS